jgi:acetyl-CoA synthetase
MKIMQTPRERQHGRLGNDASVPLEETCAATMSAWQSIRIELETGAPGGGLNMAHAAVTRHAHGSQRNRPALSWPSGSGAGRTFSFAELEQGSNRLANVFKTLGLVPGQVVATFCGRVPELYLSALGALKFGAVYCALFSAYGPEPVFHRLSASRAAMLVTTRDLYTRIRELRPRLPDLAHILLIDDPEAYGEGLRSLPASMEAAAANFPVAPTTLETPALLHFTSGTTGLPKGVVHVHAAALHHLLTGRRVLDLKPADVFWCTADPGWVTGVVYGFLAPLMAGVKTIIDPEDFDARRWLRILSAERVTVWYTSPSALRRLMALPLDFFQAFDLSALRLVFSVGEPLSAAAVRWGHEALGVPIRDTWWQTETGGIMIANHPSEAVQPGAMGRSVEGIRATVLRGTAAGNAAESCGADEVGELALAAGWPSMFRGLLDDAEAYRRRFVENWYLSGDLVRRDPGGCFWFVGRVDDMIKSAGHLVSPFEVESVLLEDPAVYEAGVVGVPDERTGLRVRAYLSVRPGVKADEHLQARIIAYARRRLGPALAPREIVFTPDMPKNQAGKILRKELVNLV